MALVLTSALALAGVMVVAVAADIHKKAFAGFAGHKDYISLPPDRTDR